LPVDLTLHDSLNIVVYQPTTYMLVWALVPSPPSSMTSLRPKSRTRSECQTSPFNWQASPCLAYRKLPHSPKSDRQESAGLRFAKDEGTCQLWSISLSPRPRRLSGWF